MKSNRYNAPLCVREPLEVSGGDHSLMLRGEPLKDMNDFKLEHDEPSQAEEPFAVQYGTLDLRLGDCMELMATFPDGHFDLAIVDPPYGIGMAANPVRQAHAPKAWDAAAPGAEYFAELRRVSKHQIVWGANHFIERLPINSACWIVWDKQQPHDFSLAAAELAWTSFSSPCKKFTARPMEPNRIHPTQKPVALYKWLLAKYAEPGMRILDTHLGSGSIAIACYYAGMHLTACEIDPGYFYAAKARIARETAQKQLL